MTAALADHLWQSVACFCLLWAAAALTRANAAHLRLWIWRVGALKFVLPFAFLFAIGEWIGFPVSYSSDEPPAGLLSVMHGVLPWSSPAQSHGLSAAFAALACLALVPLLALCAWRCRRGLVLETMRAQLELERLERDPDDREPSLGFVKAFFFTVAAILVLASPFVGGALTDRVRSYALLMRNSLSLLHATIDMAPARPGMGERWRLVADANGVLIRNANLQDLVSMVYGVARLRVTSDQMIDTDIDKRFWLTDVRYDVRIRGRVYEPERFDAYALRQPVTHLLATRFGFELYLNGKCQPPCGRWGMAE